MFVAFVVCDQHMVRIGFDDLLHIGAGAVIRGEVDRRRCRVGRVNQYDVVVFVALVVAVKQQVATVLRPNEFAL